MLQRLYVDNYKCLVDFELPLQELTLLFGLNGTGKTSVLDVMSALRRLLGGGARITDADVFATRTLTRWEKESLQIFELRILLDAEPYEYRLEIDHDRTYRRARIHLERLTRDGKPLFECRQSEVQLYRDDHSPGPRYTVDWTESALARVAPRNDNRRLTSFQEYIRKVLVCSLSPQRFRAESQSEEPTLDRDAHNFADWYRHMVQERPDLLHGFMEALREIIPGLSGIRLEKVGLDTRALMVVFDESDHRYELRFDEISDGQRALIALYALVYLSADQGHTLFLDEPDNYVALPEIQPWLMELSDACGEKVRQAVIGSHHPELIDYLGSDNGFMLQREESGVVTARRTEAPPAAEPGLRLSELFARGWE